MSKFASGGYIEGDGSAPLLPAFVPSGSCDYVIPKSLARRFAGDWLDRLNEKRGTDDD